MTVRRLLPRWLGGAPPTGHPGTALVYRGPATLPGCPEAVAAVLEQMGFRVRPVGPDGELDLDARALAGADLYAQPGGGTLEDAWRHLRRHRKDLRRWVAGGGHYVGFCLGGYLAGTGPGLKLLPGDTDQYVTVPGAAVTTEGDAVVTVSWRGARRRLYFQDGPVFHLEEDRGVEVLARYPGGEVAAAVAPYGAGRVGVVGPHPEASDDWFTDVGLPVPAGCPALDLARDLVAAVTAPMSSLRGREIPPPD